MISEMDESPLVDDRLRPRLTGEIQVPLYEICFNVLHFISFMVSAFSFIMLIQVGNYAWPEIALMVLMGLSVCIDFPVILLHSHVISDRLRSERHECYYRTNVFLYHTSWVLSWVSVPLIVLTVIYASYNVLDLICWSYLMAKLLAGTFMVCLYHTHVHRRRLEEMDFEYL